SGPIVADSRISIHSRQRADNRVPTFRMRLFDHSSVSIELHFHTTRRRSRHHNGGHAAQRSILTNRSGRRELWTHYQGPFRGSEQYACWTHNTSRSFLNGTLFRLLLDTRDSMRTVCSRCRPSNLKATEAVRSRALRSTVRTL